MDFTPYILVYKEGKTQSVSSFPQLCSALESSKEDWCEVLQIPSHTFRAAERHNMDPSMVPAICLLVSYSASKLHTYGNKMHLLSKVSFL